MNFFKNRYTAFCILALLLQQVIVASSTYWIAKLASAIVNNQPFIHYLAFFILSLIIVYIPGILSQIFMERAEYSAIFQENENFIKNHEGNIALVYDQKIENTYKAWFTHETNNIIQETFSVHYQIISILLNILFNIVALGIVIHHDIFVFYGLAFVFLFFGYHFSRKKAGIAGEKLQTERNRYNNTLLNGWNNIAIGNSLNKKLWRKIFEKNWLSLTQAGVSARFVTSGYSSLVMLAGLIPVLFGLYRILNDVNTSTVLAASIVATLPRQVQIVQFSHEFISMLFNYEAIRARVKQYLKMQYTLVPAQEILEKRIKIEKIQINGQSFSTVAQALDFMIRSRTGRLTMRGENGSGKSSLLALLKMQLGESALILPAKIPLLFDVKDIENKGHSTGEYIKYAFSKIAAEKQLKFILLDEWDANLDSANSVELSNLIDFLAKEKTLIEIRH